MSGESCMETLEIWTKRLRLIGKAEELMNVCWRANTEPKRTDNSSVCLHYPIQLRTNTSTQPTCDKADFDGTRVHEWWTQLGRNDAISEVPHSICKNPQCSHDSLTRANASPHARSASCRRSSSRGFFLLSWSQIHFHSAQFSLSKLTESLWFMELKLKREDCRFGWRW